MKLSPESVARASSRHPWTTVGMWVAFIALSGYLASTYLADALTTDIDFTDRPEAVQARDLVEEMRGEQKLAEFVVVVSDNATSADAEYMEFVGQLQTAVTALGSDKIEFVGSYLDESGPVSEDGRTVLLPVTMADPDIDDASAHAIELEEAVDAVVHPDGFETLIAGAATLNNDFQELAEETLAKGETFGIAVALVVLLVVIGTVVAAVLPLLLAIASIAVAFGLTAVVGRLFDLSFFITNFITMMGLAVGIDYSLFIVARYREERVRGADKLEAIGRAGATANRAVLFSGITVVLALLGLFFMPNTIFRSLSTGAILVVLVAVAASMTLLPAVLSLLGDKLNKLRVRKTEALNNVDKVGGFWDKITGAVMRRPVVWLLGGAALLVAIGVAYFQIQTGFSGVSTLPDDLESKQAFLILKEEFSGGLGEPLEIVADGTVTAEVTAGFDRLVEIVAGDPAFGPPLGELQVNDTGDIALLSIPLQGDAASRVSNEAVIRLRAEYVPQAFAGTDATVLVGGWPAFNIDFFDDVKTNTPIVFIFVLGLSFLLLTVVFRSIVLPIKAILLNLLSVGAAYGAIVLFFQPAASPGWIQSIAEGLGFIQVESIEAWLPLFLFAILFGLSMDYHVFLLTRIREHYDRTGSNEEAVAFGLRTTGAIITGAALIMVAVFGGFAAGDLVAMQQMGFGLAIAVFLDATIVRSILVPAGMRLLGEYNWYLPKWLEWLPEMDIEGHAAAAVAHDREAHA
ncbi:MAG: MMPL family transporter [Actinomycetota bacterium]